MADTGYFNRDDVEMIRSRAGISADFPLHERLEEAARSFKSGNPPPVPISTQKKRLKKLKDCTEDFCDIAALLCSDEGEKELGRLISSGIIGETPRNKAEEYMEKFRHSIELHKLIDVMTALNKAAATAYAEAEKDSQSKKPEDKPVKRLIGLLRYIYIEATGRRDKYTCDPITERYSGEFFNLVSAVCRRLEYSKSDKRIANLITKCTDEVDPIIQYQVERGRIKIASHR